jgi:hypothetical protein
MTRPSERKENVMKPIDRKTYGYFAVGGVVILACVLYYYAQDGRFSQQEDTWQTKQPEMTAEERQSVEIAPILYSLNESDAEERCGVGYYHSKPAVGMIIAYKIYKDSQDNYFVLSLEPPVSIPPTGSEKVGDVTLEFRSNRTETVMLKGADFELPGSNHGHPLSNYLIAKYMPCLLKGGVAK